MSYVQDSLAWSERVSMENGQHKKFLQRFRVFPLYQMTISDELRTHSFIDQLSKTQNGLNFTQNLNMGNDRYLHISKSQERKRGMYKQNQFDQGSPIKGAKEPSFKNSKSNSNNNVRIKGSTNIPIALSKHFERSSHTPNAKYRSVQPKTPLQQNVDSGRRSTEDFSRAHSNRSSTKLIQQSQNQLRQSQEQYNSIVKQKIIQRVQNLDDKEIEDLKEALKIKFDHHIYPTLGQTIDYSTKQHARMNDDRQSLGSYQSAQKSVISNRSKSSNQTYVQRLERKLREEQEARRELEQEVKEIRQMTQTFNMQLNKPFNSTRQQL